MAKVLLVDDDTNLLNTLGHALIKQGHTVTTASSAEEVIHCLATELPETIVIELNMLNMSGSKAWEYLKASRCQVPVIIMTAESCMRSAVEATAPGAFDFFVKPLDPTQLLNAIERAVQYYRLTQCAGAQPRNGTASDTVINLQGSMIIGQSSSMQKVYKTIERVAPTDATVLIRGETGTGKELLAYTIVHYSRRRAKPFLVVNCLAIPEALLESELFGQEQRSFTGATSQSIGKFEQAEGGTIFLDEIGDVSLSLQGKILRVLQERSFSRVGRNQTIHVDVRVVAATNRNLEKAVAIGEFRDDLYDHLNAVTINLPALRQRIEDVTELTKHFLRMFSQQMNTEPPAISDDALAALSAYAWPGNVRELKNCVFRAMVFNPGQALSGEMFRQALAHPRGRAAR